MYRFTFLAKPTPDQLEQLIALYRDECIEFLEKWCDERGCESDQEGELACEKQALINTLQNIEILGLPGLLIRMNQAVSALCIASHHNPNDAMGCWYWT